MNQSVVVREAVEHFDRKLIDMQDRYPDIDPWSTLDESEVSWMVDEVGKCRKDFRYAAGNYFWLGQTKLAQPSLFALWGCQEMLLDLILSLWARGEPAWVIVHKARQLGISTVVEGLMAWKTVFFENQVAMIIAQDPSQAEHLFRIMQYIYDHLPWWMQPMQASREFKEALILDNPDAQSRRISPGLNNWLIANGANKLSSFGQGKPIHALHASEISSWRPFNRAREILEGDIKYALVREPGCFAILESKPKGIGGYWYDLWHDEVDAGRRAQFKPLFIPVFFEQTRREKPPADFQASPEEAQIRERYALEWRSCSACGKPFPTGMKEGAACLACGSKDGDPVVLEDDQLYWYRQMKKAVERRKASLKLFHQEMAVTAEEGFQSSGIQVFPDDVVEILQRTCRPGWRGFFDEQYRFHSSENSKSGRCEVCGESHDNEVHPLQVWELPRDNCKYCAGVDVGYGEDDGDFSVIHMVRIGYGWDNPDAQVLEWRGHVPSGELGRICYILGKSYNDAKMCIECRGAGDVTQYELFQKLNYQNIFQWKHYDKIGGSLGTQKGGWWTNAATRPMIINNGIRWLRDKIWEVRSPEFLKEVPSFVRDDVEAQGRAMTGTHDDCVHPSTFITTLRGTVPITEVVIGDMALTHMGKFQRVERVGFRMEEKQLFRIKSIGKPDILVTDNHPMMVWDRRLCHWEDGETVCRIKHDGPQWRSINGGLTEKKSSTAAVGPTDTKDMEFVDLIDYCPSTYGVVDGRLVASISQPWRSLENPNSPGSRVIWPARIDSNPKQNRISSQLPVDKDFCLMAGYYAAEGSRGAHNVAWASHKREVGIRAWLVDYLKRLGLRPSVCSSSLNGALVSVGSVPLNRFFSQFGSRNLKQLPSWCLFLPPEKQFWILAGYLVGDGCFSPSRKGGIVAATVSHTLASQMLSISIRCGLPCSVKYATNTNGKPITFLKYSTPVANRIRGMIGPELLEGKPDIRRAVDHRCEWIKPDGPYLLGRITSIEAVPYCGPVWNLTVAEDSSYVANESVVHNCIMSALICCFCSHDDDYDPMTGRIRVPSPHSRDLQRAGNWTCNCLCGKTWDTGNPRGDTCEDCGRPPASATRKDVGAGKPRTAFLPGDAPVAEPRPDRTVTYSMF